MVKPSLSKKSKSKHLPLATTLFGNTGSTEEEHGMDDEAEASCRCFILCPCSPSLIFLLAEAFLGPIFTLFKGFEEKIDKILFGFDDFWRFYVAFGMTKGTKEMECGKHKLIPQKIRALYFIHK